MKNKTSYEVGERVTADRAFTTPIAQLERIVINA